MKLNYFRLNDSFEHEHCSREQSDQWLSKFTRNSPFTRNPVILRTQKVGEWHVVLFFHSRSFKKDDKLFEVVVTEQPDQPLRFACYREAMTRFEELTC